jgi:type IV pilus assembly protein PilW
MIRTSSTSSPNPYLLNKQRSMGTGKAACGQGRSGGFSLIELLITVVLGTLVVAGLINLFVANRKSYQLQSGNNFLQENLRIASDRIGWSLRMADFWGGNPGSTVVPGTAAAGVVTANGNCNGTWATAVNSTSANGGGIFGYDGAAAFPFDSTCIGGATNYVPGSDVLVLRFADPQVLPPGPAVTGVAPAESATITNNPKQIFVLSTPASTAQLFPGSVVPPANGSTLMNYAYPYEVVMFYLRPCSVPAGAACAATDDNGLPLPTLMRMHLLPTGVWANDPVVDGVEQMKIEYGVATDLTTNITPQYFPATTVTGNSQWANVVSVRVSLVAVNPVRDVTVPHAFAANLGNQDPCNYAIIGGSDPDVTGCPNFTPYGGNKTWQFVRTQQQFVVQLRNRING